MSWIVAGQISRALDMDLLNLDTSWGYHFQFVGGIFSPDIYGLLVDRFGRSQNHVPGRLVRKAMGAWGAVQKELGARAACPQAWHGSNGDVKESDGLRPPPLSASCAIR